MIEFFDSFLGELTVAAIIIILTIIINKIITNIIKRTIKRKNNKNLTTILLFISKLKSILIIIIGFLIALSRFDMFSQISVTLLSIIGIGTTVLSLSLKESLNNFISGIELIFNKPFEVGDFLVLPEKNISGIVEEISMRHTILKTHNNQKEVLPNKTLNMLIVENHNKKIDEIRLSTIITVSNEKNIDKVIKMIKEEIVNVCEITDTEINTKIEYPKVDVIEFDHNVTKIRAWVIAFKLDDAYNNLYNLNLNVRKKLDKIK